jgi:hypothetical protein
MVIANRASAVAARRIPSRIGRSHLDIREEGPTSACRAPELARSTFTWVVRRSNNPPTTGIPHCSAMGNTERHVSTTQVKFSMASAPPSGAPSGTAIEPSARSRRGPEPIRPGVTVPEPFKTSTWPSGRIATPATPRRESPITGGRRQWRTAVCYLDLDGLKPTNDSLGHHAGDTAIQLAARRLRVTARAGDVAADSVVTNSLCCLTTPPRVRTSTQ